jgi:iron complex outermembrane recepter protein
MKKIFNLMAILVLLSFGAIAQNEASLKGKVLNNNNAVKKATISLLNASDSSLAKTAVTNDNGEFEIENIKAGNYLIQSTAIGYKSIYTKAFALAEKQNLILENINVAIAVKTGEEVVVKAKKPLIEVKADKMVFNVEGSINAIGTNAFDLLRKSPGVVIDKDDNLMLKGKNGVRIFLDGKPTPFYGKDLAAYLKNINSADIEAIELITNPSARYEAEGNAGIINIRLKKSKKLGYNGSISLGAAIGITPKLNSSVTMNYRKNKWNLFGNYSNSTGDNESNFNFYRIVLDSIFDQKIKNINGGTNHNFKIGADNYADKNSTWGVIATGSLSSSEFRSNSTSPIKGKNSGALGSTLYATNEINGRRDNLNLNFNYRYTDTTGVEGGIDVDRGWYKNTDFSLQPNEYRYVANLLNPVYKIYRNNTPTDINITSIKADYGFPFKKGKLEIGGKYSTVNTKNASDFYNVINNVDVVDLGRTNKFTYKENINALYANYNKQLNPKWTIQAGVRMENTNSEGILTSAIPQNDATVKRNYTNLFPSGALSYNANMNNSFNLTYSRRIDRPGYQSLNPFENKLDELTFQKGNAFLRPQYSNVVEFTHTYKYRYNTTLSYTKTTDFSSQIIDTADGYKSFITQKNLASQQVMGINFSAPVQLKKWWSLFANINANYTKYDATFPDGKKINTSVTSGSFFAQNTFSLNKGFNIEVSGFYQLPTIWGGTFESNGIGGMDVGMSAPMFNNKATIRFSYSDLLHTMKFRGVSNFGGNYFDANGTWESQQFKVNFNYRFGNKQIKANTKKNAGNEDEQKRAQKTGGGFGGGN